MRYDDLTDEFERLFGELSRRSRPIRFEPNADVWISDDGAFVHVSIDIAGADPSELRAGIEDGYLYVLGKRANREQSWGGEVLMKEIDYGEFVKKIHLPVTVDHEAATASYRDGMLTIALPVLRRATAPVRRSELRMIVRRISV
jgi:HSP20 family protein